MIDGSDGAPCDLLRWDVTERRAPGSTELMNAMLEGINPSADARLDAVAGTISLENHDSTWIFTPSVNWIANPYRVQIEAKLEAHCQNFHVKNYAIKDTALSRTVHAKIRYFLRKKFTVPIQLRLDGSSIGLTVSITAKQFVETRHT